MNRDKAWEDLLATLDNLEDSISLYRSGRKNAYRQVAISLRTLLCDSEPVLIRIFPTAALHPLNSFVSRLSEEQTYLLKDLVFSQPGSISLNGRGGARIENLFYEGELLLLQQWLAQPLINEKVTLREFITSIADKEGKHLDQDYNDTLKLMKSMSLANVAMHPELIVVIGEYVYGLLRHITTNFFSKKEIEYWIKRK